MRIRSGRAILTAAVVASTCGAGASVALAQNEQSLRTVRIASGMTRPIFLTAPVGDPSRLFIVEQRTGTTNQATAAQARIRIIDNSNLSAALPYPTQPTASAFLTLNGIGTQSEQGLLGLAFHPQYQQNGYFWVNYTRFSDGATVIQRFRAPTIPATPGTFYQADAASATTVLIIPQDFANHNGGWMSFGPDGFLYIATGDGGSGNDPNQRGQSLNSLLGKVLRIDVDGPDNIPGNADDDGFPADANRLYVNPSSNPFFGPTTGLDEIWLLGVRNPWRNAFDATGRLWIADVGQDEREEVTVVPASPTAAQRNLGWRCWEGTRFTGLAGCTTGSPNTIPSFEYGHNIPVGPTNFLGCSITGGEVYNGSGIACLRGTYFFSDACVNQIWTYQLTATGTPTNVVNRTAEMTPPTGQGTIANIFSFGTDARGEMYVLDGSSTAGEVFSIRAGNFTGPDCNANGRPDRCDIAEGLATDANNNNIPDSCEPPPGCDAIDFNNDGVFPDDQDLNDFIFVLGGGACATCNDVDFNNDGVFPDDSDLEIFLFVLGGGSC